MSHSGLGVMWDGGGLFLGRMGPVGWVGWILGIAWMLRLLSAMERPREEAEADSVRSWLEWYGKIHNR
jgi:membrane protein required for beta-lactamase induction